MSNKQEFRSFGELADWDRFNRQKDAKKGRQPHKTGTVPRPKERPGKEPKKHF